jgi:hypothetical protein
MAALGDLILKLGVNTKNFDKGLGASMRKFKSFGANTKRLGKSLTKSLTLPLLAVGASSFKVAAEFEQSMLKVKAVSGATGAEFKALEADALRLGSATRFSASEVSGLQLEFAKLGFTSSEITKVTEATLALAQASDSDLATAAEVAGSTLRAFGLDASETQRVTDVMASSFSSSALDMSLFKDSMKFVAPVAKSAGLSLEETSAMLAALANNGIKGSQAGTALRRIIQELGTGSGTVSEKIAALNESGLNLTSSFDEVGRSASSALLVLGNSIGDVGNLTTQFEGAEGAAAGMAATMDSGAMGGIARMKSAIEGAQIAIGSALAPTISKIVDKIAELAQRFTNLDSSTKDMIITIGGLAAVIGPLLVVLPTMISAIGTALSLIATPVGAIIAIVAALAAAFLYFFDDIKGPMVDFINFFINLYNESMIFRGAVQSVIMHFKNMFAVGKFIFTSLYDIISTIVSRIGENLSAFGEIITGVFTFDAAKISSGWNRLMDNSFGGIGDIINDVAENGAMLGETLVDNFTTAARNTLEGDPVEFVTTEDLDRVKDKIEGLIPDFNFFGGSGSEGGGSPTEPIEEIIEEVETLDEVLSEPPANVFFDALSNSFNKLKQDTVELGRLGDQMGNAFSNTFKEVLDGSRTAQGGLGSFLKTTIDMALAASTGLIIEAMINSGKFTGPAAPFVIPALVTAGIGMVRGLFSAIKVPAMAEGGIVSGNTLVQVGEYAGAASNPEVIAPLDKLRSMLGNSTNGGAVEVHGVIRGRDIFLTNERASREVGNLRGAF